MPTYDFRCDEHGYEERVCGMSQRKEQKCSTCQEIMTQVLLRPPSLDNTAMANCGMPGAIEKQGNEYVKRHQSVSQAHRPVARDGGLEG